jgi:hypothetical protein
MNENESPLMFPRSKIMTKSQTKPILENGVVTISINNIEVADTSPHWKN